MTHAKKKRRRFSPLLILALLLIFSGIGALTYPIVGDYLASRQRSVAVENYDKVLDHTGQKKLNQQLKLASEYNADILAEQTGRIVPYPSLKYIKIANLAGIMGTLDVPAISIKKMPIYHGTNELTLSEGLGHFEPSSIPIGGKNTRAVISGHSGLENQVLFSNVRNLQVGDIFYINILGKRLAYKIESMDEVLPKDVDKVKIVPNKDMVTLLTCTPPGVNTYRLLVNGVRIPFAQAQKEAVHPRDTFSYTRVVIASLIACLVLFFILYLIYRRLRKRYIKATSDESRAKTEKALLRLFFIIKALFVAMIVAMVAVLAFAIYGYTQIQRQREMSSINVGQTEQLADYNLSKIRSGNYTESDISSVTVGTYANAKINFNQVVNNWGIGKLSIPGIDVSLPILAGMNNENLLNGAATLNDTEQMGKGNYILLSHNISNGYGVSLPVLLGRISELKIGQKITVSDFSKVYTYKVMLNQVVKDTEVQYIKQPNSPLATPLITLIRCEGRVGTSFRRVIQGQLIETQPLKQLGSTQLKTLGIEHKGVLKKAQAGKIYSGDLYTWYESLAIMVAAMMVNNPLQTIIPVVLMLVVPILFLNLI
ncbi:class C sortase [Lactococcus hircilactis]|uniref:Class C sortase n=1 Tax=Lactococcus hircilactis TaxID=1494462 RepID=A0A7X1Z7B0_9LACT|nr:class C sortase [Lactococcus hircilactis]MQW39074.1 class C sortase [Lactococcus hircilactis]